MNITSDCDCADEWDPDGVGAAVSSMHHQLSDSSTSSSCGVDVLHTGILTLAVCATFLVAKSALDELRKLLSRVTVVVIGAGPVGLLSALIAAKCGRVSCLVMYEEKSRSELLNNNYQLTLDPKSVQFLTSSLAIDFDNIEGCWDKGAFSTRVGVFLEYLMSTLSRLDLPLDFKLKTKFKQDSLKELDRLFGRLVVIVCDGATGRAASLLGLSDEFVTHSCRSYGAFAILERKDQHSVPAPEVRVHNLNFDLNAYDNDLSVPSSHGESQGFHLKIFGCLKTRCLALAAPKGESKVIKMLRLALDQSVMRNLFRTCYNAYKTEEERHISDVDAARHMKFSPRLFEVKLSQRMESVAFVEDANVFVVTEGDTTRKLNFYTGLDVNLGIRGLLSLNKFLQMAASAESDKSILQAMMYKHNHSKTVTMDFSKNGLKSTMYT